VAEKKQIFTACYRSLKNRRDYDRKQSSSVFAIFEFLKIVAQGFRTTVV